MWSSGVSIAATVPALAANPDWNTTHASTFLKRAMRSSSSMCSDIVPEMVRTAPEPTPYFFTGFDGRLAQLGMRGQPQVIVGGQVDDLPAVEARFRGALRFQDAQPLVGALVAPLLQLIVKDTREDCSHSSVYNRCSGRRNRSADRLPSPAPAPFRPRRYRDRPRSAAAWTAHSMSASASVSNGTPVFARAPRRAPSNRSFPLRGEPLREIALVLGEHADAEISRLAKRIDGRDRVSEADQNQRRFERD